ncbi:hypothetical protein SLE2022_402880 [Rubroshorea leprosula]|uniref:Membrane-associated kinase regulator 5 n=1 Tax=Rubroshorea leprosula TaxID=152421 RepID=A0AAV5L2C0_9ROSI|nr:hypothetical protein SLEP1_g39959 [Rubroshorea leprosula]
MEALNLFKFWRPTNNTQKEIPNPVMEFEEGEDSFFDLKLPLRDHPEEKIVVDNAGFASGDEKPARIELINVLRPTLSLSPTDNFSRRKIIPIESSSPIALLKSAPKFRVFASKKLTKSTATAEKSERMKFAGVSKETPKHEKLGGPKLPIFMRGNSLRKTESISWKTKTEELFRDDSSKRFSKDVIHKYLNRLKASKKQTEKSKSSGDVSIPSPASSPATMYSTKEKQRCKTAGIRGVCKHLGKSKSASATASQMSRRDDSLLLQHDGIQSAILHCKTSFNSSRGSSSMSSDSSLEKLSNASSTDSSMLSRFSTDSAFEKLH